MYKGDTTFSVASFSQQYEEATCIIGPDRNGAYLSISPAIAHVLSQLAVGCTFTQVCQRFCTTADDFQDLGDALSMLEKKGLISTAGRDSAVQIQAGRVAPSTRSVEKKDQRSLLTGLALILCHRQALYFYCAIIMTGAFAAAADPRIVPGPSSMFFGSHRCGAMLFVILINILAVSLHELAHFLAARAVGISASFGFGNRLWIVVAETDLSGIWAVPRNLRYLPLLAGPLCDAICASLLLSGLYLNRHMVPVLSQWNAHLAAAITFAFFTRLLWQCFFFVRTDFYYVFATARRCTNLMDNTRLYVQGLLRRAFRRMLPCEIDIPEEELSTVRIYAWFWLAGQMLALAVFVLISVPLTVKYIQAGLTVLRRPSGVDVSTMIDTLASYVLVLLPWFAGVFMWGRQLAGRRSWVTQ